MAIEGGVAEAAGELPPLKVLFDSVGWIDVKGDLPQAVSWQPNLPYERVAANGVRLQAGDPNQGCPPGFAAQQIPDDAGGQVTVCRRLDWAYVHDPSIQQQEQALGWIAYLAQLGGAVLDPSLVVRFFTAGVPQVLEYAARLTGRTAAAALGPVVSANPLLYVALGLAALAFLWSKR